MSFFELIDNRASFLIKGQAANFNIEVVMLKLGLGISERFFRPPFGKQARV
jgi:hypothetical protein